MCLESLVLALGKRLRSSRSIRTLGVRVNWEDYPAEIRRAIREADAVFYPSVLYEDVLQSLGKRTFPRNYYAFMGNKILQTHLFQLLEISHPRTRLYYGRQPLSRIVADFDFPFLVKSPMGSSKGEGVHRIASEMDLISCMDRYRPVYVQELLPIDRDLRVVLLGGVVVHAYWRIQRPGEFRCNVARGAAISLRGIPAEGLAFAKDVARRCGFEEVGLDVCRAHGRWYVLEANMVFGLEGFRRAGLEIHEQLRQVAEQWVDQGFGAV